MIKPTQLGALDALARSATRSPRRRRSLDVSRAHSLAHQSERYLDALAALFVVPVGTAGWS